MAELDAFDLPMDSFDVLPSPESELSAALHNQQLVVGRLAGQDREPLAAAIDVLKLLHNVDLTQERLEYSLSVSRMGDSILPAERIPAPVWTQEDVLALSTSEAADNVDTALIFEASRGKLNGVKDLVTLLGADVNEANALESTALIRSSFNGHADVVEWLIDNGAELDWKNVFGSTALSCAVAQRHRTVVELLVARGADANAGDNNNDSPLLHAAANGDVAIAEILLAAGADLHQQNTMGSNAFSRAAGSGQLHMMDWLYKKGSNANNKNNFGATPFSRACSGGHLKCLEWFVKRKLKIDPKRGALKAAANGHTNILAYLCDNGLSDVDCAVDGLPLIAAAAQNGHTKAVKWLAERGAIVDACSEADDLPPICYAALAGDIPTVVYLLPLVKDERARQYLPACAAVSGSIPLMKYLLTEGCSVSSTDATGRTPLLTACLADQRNMVQYLLSHGSSLEEKDMDGDQALHLASSDNLTTMMRYLLSLGVNPSMANHVGVTPLLCAVANKCEEAVRLLLTSGARLDEKDNFGNTASSLGWEG